MFTLRHNIGRWATRTTSHGLSMQCVGSQHVQTACLAQLRCFRSAAKLQAVQPYLLADIGEGITECQIISWLVKPGDQVQQFDPICEIQSDKASVEITSRFEGRIEKLHYDVGEMAIVGAPLLEIDVQEAEDQETATKNTAESKDKESDDIPALSASAAAPTPSGANGTAGGDEDRRVALSPVQMQMFQSMTRSLAIPHFLFTQIVDLTPLMDLRQRLNNDAAGNGERISVLPFVLKAISDAVTQFPMLNSIVADDQQEPQSPHIVVKAAHNFGVAVDTSKGLVVPVVRDVQSHTIRSLAAEVARLGKLARDGRLRPHDMQGASLVVSNIGSIGGHTVAPVILAPMAAIVAIGRVEQVPAFRIDAQGNEEIFKKSQVVLSWSADHRILDGATVAKCAQQVASWLEKADESVLDK